MSEVVEGASSSSASTTLCDDVVELRDVGGDAELCSVDGRPAERTCAVEDTVLDESTNNNKPSRPADAVPPASEPLNVGGRAASCVAGGVDEPVQQSDVVQSTSSARQDLGVVDAASVTAGVSGQVADVPVARPCSDALAVGNKSPTVGRAARHALPSAVAAAPPPGKHRLPPVLTTTTPHGHGQASHGAGLEPRMSPLSLVVGGASSVDSLPRASASLTGGTRLGDLGLSQPPPPLNLSVSDEAAVNMKVVSQRSTSTDATSRAAAGRPTSCQSPCTSHFCLVYHAWALFYFQPSVRIPLVVRVPRRDGRLSLPWCFNGDGSCCRAI